MMSFRSAPQNPWTWGFNVHVINTFTRGPVDPESRHQTPEIHLGTTRRLGGTEPPCIAPTAAYMHRVKLMVC